MEGISPFQSGRPLLSEVTADKLNRILAEIKRNRPVVSAPLVSRVTGDGTYIHIADTKRGGPSLTEPHPFQITTATDPENPDNIIVTVRPGTINGILAGNWSATRTMTKEAVNYIVLSVTTDGQAVTSTAWAEEASSPTPDTPQKWALSTTLKVLLGIVANGSVKQIISDNLLATGVKRVTTEKNQVTLGQIPYDNWYAWQVT